MVILCLALQPCCQPVPQPSGTFWCLPEPSGASPVRAVGGGAASTTCLQLVWWKLWGPPPKKKKPKGQQSYRGSLERGTETHARHHEQAGHVYVQGELRKTWRCKTGLAWMRCVIFPLPCGKRKVLKMFAIYLWDCPCLPASTWCPVNRWRAMRRRGRVAANRQAAAVRTGRNMLREGPDNAAQLFLLYHRAVKLKNDLKSKGCAGSTGVSRLWALGAFCVNWTFFPCFFGWLNIAAVEGKSNNTLGVQSLLPDPSGTELHQSELRTEAKPGCSLSFHCCNPKRGGYFSAEVAREKALSFFY